MIDNKKEQERAELHAAIWKIADDLRGSVDGWDFKAYVVGAMFYRFLSENLAADFEKQELKKQEQDKKQPLDQKQEQDNKQEFLYAKLSDEQAEAYRKTTIERKGFFIKPSELFQNVFEVANNAYEKKEPLTLCETLKKAFENIEKSAKGATSETHFRGLFNDFDLNSAKLGNSPERKNETLFKVLQGVNNMNLRSSHNTIDAFGDAYEYLMQMYASNAGKSGGEFFTPQEVSELLAKLVAAKNKSIASVYDPACGSGSLLLKVAQETQGQNAVLFYGQEINVTTYNMCRINMILHNVSHNRFDICNDDTLTAPCKAHKEKGPFDAIVSNPPYSIAWKGEDEDKLVKDYRFEPAGALAPKSRADLAFVMHSLAWLAEEGTAAIICFPGVMYRGGKEQTIRKYLVDANVVDCVIQLPGNLFYGTSIATCVMTLKKNKRSDGVLFIDASEECVKVTNNNKLSEENIKRIVDATLDRKDVPYFATLASAERIREQDYNLSVSSYVEQRDRREKIDIVALNNELREIVQRENRLRDEIDRIVAEIEGQEIEFLDCAKDPTPKTDANAPTKKKKGEKAKSAKNDDSADAKTNKAKPSANKSKPKTKMKTKTKTEESKDAKKDAPLFNQSNEG